MQIDDDAKQKFSTNFKHCNGHRKKNKGNQASASLSVLFTLPGMIEDPGSLAGKDISPIEHLGPEERSLMSFAIFITLHQ